MFDSKSVRQSIRVIKLYLNEKDEHVKKIIEALGTKETYLKELEGLEKNDKEN